MLGAEPAQYDLTAAAIRFEYRHIDEADYRTGRAAVLHGFLDREQLYFTEIGRNRFDASARSNLARELTALEGHVD